MKGKRRTRRYHTRNKRTRSKRFKRRQSKNKRGGGGIMIIKRKSQSMINPSDNPMMCYGVNKRLPNNVFYDNEVCSNVPSSLMKRKRKRRKRTKHNKKSVSFEGKPKILVIGGGKKGGGHHHELYGGSGG